MQRRSRLILLTALTAGCGYHMVQGNALFGRRSVAVVPFAETTPAGLAPGLAHHLNRLLSAHGMQVTASSTAAQSILDGQLTLITTPSVTRLGVTTYQLGASIHAELRDANGESLWRTDLTVREDFLPAMGTDVQPLATEALRRTALARLAERAAHGVHEALLVATSVAANPALRAHPEGA